MRELGKYIYSSPLPHSTFCVMDINTAIAICSPGGMHNPKFREKKILEEISIILMRQNEASIRNLQEEIERRLR